MAQTYSNNASSALASGYTAGDTTITVQAGHGAKFPATGDFMLAIDDPVAFYLKCTSRSTDTLTVSTTGQEGTTAANKASGKAVSHVITAGVMDALLANMTGDSGSGGIKGLVPAPSSGDASAAKFLKADATWAVPAGTGVTSARTISTTAPLTGGGDLSADRTLAISNMVGDSGSGGTKGAVPAPAAGDAAASRFLKADGTWAIPAGTGGSGTVNPSGTPANHQLPVWVSGTDIKGITGGGGTVLQGVESADPSFTATPTLGVAGSTVGTQEFANATSGTVKLSPVTGALGSTVITLPAATGTAVVASTSSTTTQALFATSTAGAPAFRAVAAADLPTMVGDSGSGGTKGAVTAPGSGDAASGKFLKADGTWAVPPGSSQGALTLLEQHTASSSATLTFTASISATYDEYLIEFVNLLPATDNATLYIQVSTDGGSSYDTGNNYKFCNSAITSNTGTGLSTSASASGVYLASTISNVSANGGVSGRCTLYGAGATKHLSMLCSAVGYASGPGAYLLLSGSGVYASTTAVNAFRLTFLSGNIASGTVRVYGIAK